MNRKDFLKQLGLSSAALFAVHCMGTQGCSSETDPAASPATGVDFTLDLADSANAALNADGGYVIKQRIVIARTTTGNYVAVTQVCSHAGYPNMSYQKSTNIFYCNVHGAQYDTAGKGLNSNGRKGLTTYNTSLSGTSLRIYS